MNTFQLIGSFITQIFAAGLPYLSNVFHNIQAEYLCLLNETMLQLVTTPEGYSLMFIIREADSLICSA